MPLLNEVAMRAAVSFRARPMDEARPVRFTHLSRYLDSVNLTQTRFSNYLGERTASQVRADDEPRLILAFPAGPMGFEQNGSQVRARADSLVAFWSLAPWRVLVDDGVDFVGVALPLTLIGLPHLLVRDLMGQELGRSPLAPLLSDHFRNLLALPPLPVEQERLMVAPTIGLVQAALTLARGDEFASRGPLARTLGLRVMAYLKAHAGDPGLTTDAVAERFGISRRYLFAVLKEAGVSMHEWLREERLQRAAAMLAAPDVSVAAVARLAGFRHHSSFTRSFRVRFGCSPTEWTRLNEAQRAALITTSSISSP